MFPETADGFRGSLIARNWEVTTRAHAPFLPASRLHSTLRDCDPEPHRELTQDCCCSKERPRTRVGRPNQVRRADSCVEELLCRLLAYPGRQMARRGRQDQPVAAMP